MAKETFPHGFTEETKIEYVFGYSQALNDVTQHIKAATAGGRILLIDPLPLLERIGATSAELSNLGVSALNKIQKQISDGNKV